MVGTLIEITLGKPEILEGTIYLFNNDSENDKKRISFYEAIPPFNFYGLRRKNKVPKKYLHKNVHKYDSNEIYVLKNNIIIGEYCNHGIIVPRTKSIIFNQLYNCTPLISLIKGDEEYISFLHTWAIPDNSKVVDKQVKHWMKTVSKFGDISETIFAPRKNGGGSDTKYITSIEDIIKISKKTILLNRNVSEIKGIANGEGVYFDKCGYHLWKD